MHRVSYLKEMIMEITHRPKGSMCVNCLGMRSGLVCPEPSEFKDMKKIGKDKDGVIVVKCTNFARVIHPSEGVKK